MWQPSDHTWHITPRPMMCIISHLWPETIRGWLNLLASLAQWSCLRFLCKCHLGRSRVLICYSSLFYLGEWGRRQRYWFQFTVEWTEAETIQAVTKIKCKVILITKSMTIATNPLDVLCPSVLLVIMDHPLLQSVTVNIFEEVFGTKTGNCIFSLFAVNLD